MKLTDAVTRLKGVGPKMAEKLARLGIATVEDLLNFYPRRYQDWTKITPMEELTFDEGAAVYGEVVDVKEARPRPRMSILTAVLTDGTGAVNLVYFNQPWKRDEFARGQHILAYGRAEYQYRKIQMSNADTEAVEPAELAGFQKLVPVYPLTEGLKLSRMQELIRQALAQAEDLAENLPARVLREERLMGRREALAAIHFPKSWAEQKAARRRLAFEELFFMQAGIALLRKKRQQGMAGIKCAPSGRLVADALRHLPFTLTEDQRRAFADIEDDMEGLVPMQRLVQGDVGSGKTAVAALAVAKMTENGYQSTLMVPTEVLAQQHFQTLTGFYEGLPIRTALLTGTTKAAERRQILEDLAAGAIDLLIGTHALLEDDVVFARLGLVITDEQHRFGVKQREALETKGEAPHTLIMTATPIPRTMALSVYGDLDVSAIRGMPPGRHPVKTYAVGRDLLQRVYRFMEREMDAGHQVYVVCPLVAESEKQDLAAAEKVYRELSEKEFPRHRCGMVHGRMKEKDKEQVMEDFRTGRVQLLVATSVIEVGVNVPNATIMFVYGADRFGLSQLHQLRGRVGRGSAQSYCILYTDSTSDTARVRMELMTQIQDGFLLAEKDLLLRGSGEFFGYHQHGMPDLRAADILRDLPLLEEARRAARREVAAGLDCREELARRFGGKFFERIYH